MQAALDNTKLREPITIYVKGVCNDGPFVIHQDVRLIGSPAAHLSAPSGSHDVVGLSNGAYAELTNLTVDASSQIVGIAVHNNTTASINTVTVSGASEPAVNVADGSHAGIRNGEFYGNGTGVQVNQGASAWMQDSSVHDDDFWFTTMVFSSVSLAGKTIVDNASIGVVAAGGGTYGNVTLRETPNIIEDNGTDVYCDAGGLLSAQQVQVSSTGKIVIDLDCRVFGTIF